MNKLEAIALIIFRIATWRFPGEIKNCRMQFWFEPKLDLAALQDALPCFLF
jgi:hypothetical protein